MDIRGCPPGLLPLMRMGAILKAATCGKRSCMVVLGGCKRGSKTPTVLTKYKALLSLESAAFSGCAFGKKGAREPRKKEQNKAMAVFKREEQFK